MHVTARLAPALVLAPTLPKHDGEVAISRDWRGAPVPPSLRTTASVAWTASHLWFGFTCAFSELDLDAPPDIDTTTERFRLWERDVCEAFVQSPAEATARAYKEFEVAPTGQWCDLAIRDPRLDVDWQWASGMATAAAIDATRREWRAVMRIPFAAFGLAPREGDEWAINLFRIGRHGGERHYLALSPTGTDTPDFHQPRAFVPLRFAGPR